MMTESDAEKIKDELNIDISRLARDYSKEPLKRGEQLSFDELKYLYLDLNMSQSELKVFTGKTLDGIIHRLKLTKTKEQQKAALKRSNLRKYGCECPLKSKLVIEKRNKTNLEKYGHENPFGNKEIQEKIKQTNLQKYGCEHAAQNEKVKQKTKDTCLKKYETEAVAQNEKIKQKIKRTNLERHGVSHTLQCSEIKKRIKQTNLEKYGVENPLKSKEIQEKVKQTNLEKYGTPCPIQNFELKKKVAAANLEKYGHENPFGNKEIQEKIKQTNLQKYGCEHISQKHIPSETLRILSCRESLEDFIKNQENKTILNLGLSLKIGFSALCSYCHKYDLWHLIDHHASSYEKEIQEMFPFMQKTKKILYPYEIDLYSEAHKFGIEFNGNYWHSEQKGLNFLYHQKKSLLAEEKGIFLYHIWEYEWLDPMKRSIILSQIKNILNMNERKIFARKCILNEVSTKETRKFLEENHLQSHCASSVRLGLYYGDELVSLMTFGKPRFRSECEYELLRFCNKKNVSVVGGASKLFKHFIQEYSPKSILSYSLMAKASGKMYRNLGFNLNHVTDPEYVWVKVDKVLSRYQCQKHKLLAQGFEGNSEREIMENRGYHRIFGCGNKAWIWILD